MQPKKILRVSGILAVICAMTLTCQKEGQVNPTEPEPTAQTYTVDLDVHVGRADNSKFVQIPVSKGTHTFKMKSSTASFGWNDIVYLFLSGDDDDISGGSESIYHHCTLNGVGDQITVNLVRNGRVEMGVLDGYIPDNYGEIVVSIDNIQDVTVDLDVHVGSSDNSKFLQIPVSKGTYTIKMKSSTASFGWNDIVHLYLSGDDDDISGGSESIYHHCTLNGVGDQVTVKFVRDGKILAGVLDGYIADNYGEIVLEVN